VALLSITAVVAVLNGAAVRVTHPAWVQWTGGAIEAGVWLLMTVVFARSLLTDREAKRAVKAASDLFKQEDPTPNAAEQSAPQPEWPLAVRLFKRVRALLASNVS
jgi:hydrogenase maturation factor